jgi:hypothetical protein
MKIGGQDYNRDGAYCLETKRCLLVVMGDFHDLDRTAREIDEEIKSPHWLRHLDQPLSSEWKSKI